MGRYSKIDRGTWGDEAFKRLSSPRPNAQFLWLFLLSGPHNKNFPGLFHVGIGAISDLLSWPYAATDRCIKEIETAKKTGFPMLIVDRKNSLMFAPSAFEYNPPDNPNVAKGWARSLAELPECTLLFDACRRADEYLVAMSHGRAFVDAFRAGCREVFGKDFGKPFQEPLAKPLTKPFTLESDAKGFGKGLAKQEQEQDIATPPYNPPTPSGSPKTTARKPSSPNGDSSDANDKLTPEAIVELYNNICGGHLTKCSSLSDKRLRNVKKLIASGFKRDDYIKAFSHAITQPFLRGKGDRGWKADFEYATREDKFVKLLEGGTWGDWLSETSTTVNSDATRIHPTIREFASIAARNWSAFCALRANGIKNSRADVVRMFGAEALFDPAREFGERGGFAACANSQPAFLERDIRSVLSGWEPNDELPLQTKRGGRGGENESKVGSSHLSPTETPHRAFSETGDPSSTSSSRNEAVQ